MKRHEGAGDGSALRSMEGHVHDGGDWRCMEVHDGGTWRCMEVQVHGGASPWRCMDEVHGGAWVNEGAYAGA